MEQQIKKLEERQSKALEDHEKGLLSEMERDIALQIAYEEICRLDPKRKED
jgi:hypothetical protein